MDFEFVGISLIPENLVFSFPSRGGPGTPDENIAYEIWDQKEIDISAGIAYGSNIFDIICNPTRTVVTIIQEHEHDHIPPHLADLRGSVLA
jgi:hypothetical protein